LKDESAHYHSNPHIYIYVYIHTVDTPKVKPQVGLDNGKNIAVANRGTAEKVKVMGWPKLFLSLN